MSTSTPQSTEAPATEPQRAFVRTLLRERYEGEALAIALEAIEDPGFPKPAASAWIDALKRTPKLAAKPAPKPAVSTAGTTVPEGRYAVEVDGKLGFFRVDTPETGRWEGYTFVNQMASDDRFPVRGERRQRVLDLIAADPAGASRRYGHELGSCGVCGRTLTDAASREAGVGPVCAGRMGW